MNQQPGNARNTGPQPRPLTDEPSANARPAPSRHWLRQFGRDFATLCWLKAAGTALFMGLFFKAYFHLLHHPARPVFVMPSTALDQAIGFSAPWVLAYFSLWLYVSLPGALQGSGRALFWHAWGFFVLCLAGLLFYYFFPTTFVQPAVDWSPMPIGRILQTVDQAGNAFPSMHVAAALFAGLWLRRELRRVQAPRCLEVLSASWCAAIIYSTLATKQHVVLDVMAGAVLGAALAWASIQLADRCRSASGVAHSPRPPPHR
ncbi:MAG: phosphatase PAP2 family protein [Brachymonas sp.]|nr:phosphatase PAP2 family protein [Brachymonas sp.]